MPNLLDMKQAGRYNYVDKRELIVALPYLGPIRILLKRQIAGQLHTCLEFADYAKASDCSRYSIQGRDCFLTCIKRMYSTSKSKIKFLKKLSEKFKEPYGTAV